VIYLTFVALLTAFVSIRLAYWQRRVIESLRDRERLVGVYRRCPICGLDRMTVTDNGNRTNVCSEGHSWTTGGAR
jgi:hypothetical protein